MAVTILLGLCLAICMITDIIKRTVDIRVLILFFCMLMICGFIEKNISIHNITAGLFAAALFAALSFVSKGAIGMGDALLYSCIVCFVGMEKAFYIIFMSVMFAFFAALYLVIVKRKEKKYEIPLVPFIFIDRCKAGTSAPGQALFLVNVEYPESIFECDDQQSSITGEPSVADNL